MSTHQTLLQFKNEVEHELRARILPFWIEKVVDHEQDGFYGQISNDLRVDKNSEKGCILNSRILWTFAAAYRIFKNKQYLAVASRAYDYLVNHFWDDQYAGLYFMVDSRGKVTNPRKQVYNLAFGIYGLSEYYRAVGTWESLDRAIDLYRLIEKNCYDRKHKGYFEACARDWSTIADMRLSAKDLNVEKSMNTHLHLLEAYTNLFRVWQDPLLRFKLKELIQVTLEHIIDPATCHFKLFFDGQWSSKADIVSMGHDIEGSWLLYEAAEVLGDHSLLTEVRKRSIDMAQKVFDEGIDDQYGGLFNEFDHGVLKNAEKIWWPQCEAMVGFFNTYQLTGEERFFKAAYEIWKFSEKYLLDNENGEWFGEVSRDGKPNKDYYKVGLWKCPYHNGRACMELIARIKGD